MRSSRVGNKDKKEKDPKTELWAFPKLIGQEMRVMHKGD